MGFRVVSALAVGLALSGCAGNLGGASIFGETGYPAQPDTYACGAYGAPYADYGYVPSYGYAPGYEAPYGVPPTFVAPFVYEQPRRDWRREQEWREHGGDWNRGQSHVWAGPPGTGHPAYVAPPHWQHDQAWSHHGGDWNHAQPHVWAGPPGAGHPINMAPPPTPRAAPPPVRVPNLKM